MTTSPVTQTPAPTAGTAGSIAGDFDAFLKLLTTQLANQDPLSPMDSNQFTEQLVQFAGVEQAVNTNTKLDQLVSLLDMTRLSTGAQYLGREVVADGRTMSLGKTGATSFTMHVGEQPAQVLVRVLDDAQRQIATFEAQSLVGTQEVVWNGRGDDGLRAPAGTYRVEVAAVDAAGRPLEVATGFIGTVSAVESDGQTLHLQVGDRRVAIDDIEAVRVPAAPNPDEGVAS